MLGQALAYAPNVNSAVLSASRIMKLIERKPKMSNPQAVPGIDYDVSELSLKIKINLKIFNLVNGRQHSL
jgi:hypothetical protein